MAFKKKEKTSELETIKDLAKLEYVPKGSGETALAVLPPGLIVTELPAGLVKISRPALVKPEMLPIGGMLSGKIISVAGPMSDKVSKDSQLLHLKNGETEFYFPLTGTIKQDFKGLGGAEANLGKTVWIKRLADGETRKYCKPTEPAKKMFQFEVYLSK
jgi:hypothetical protein